MDVAILFSNKAGFEFTVGEKHMEMVQQALPDARVYFGESGDELAAQGADPEILITWVTGGGHFIAEEYCMGLKNLKWIHGLSAGVEGVTQSAVATIPGLILTNAKGTHGVPISEHVLGYMIYHYLGFNRNRAAQAAQVWDRFIPQELYGKTISILGMGSIASDVAKRAKAFGMTVLGVKRTMADIEYVDEVLTNDRMDEAISRADTLVMLLPAMDETDKIMDAGKFAIMKDGAFFVNVGRGQTVDTAALVQALKSGKLSGAALDALDPEPLPAGHPLWSMDNVFITPHMSAQSPMYMHRAFQVFQNNVPYYLRGERMPSQMDIDKY